jgi:hypothetical protein
VGKVVGGKRGRERTMDKKQRIEIRGQRAEGIGHRA